MNMLKSSPSLTGDVRSITSNLLALAACCTQSVIAELFTFCVKVLQRLYAELQPMPHANLLSQRRNA